MRRTPKNLKAVFVAALVAVGAVQDARSGAWTRPSGEGQMIVTAIRQGSPVGSVFDGLGGEDTNFSEFSFEYGVADGYTVGGGVFYQGTGFKTDDVTAAITARFRTRVWSNDQGDIASIQIGGGYPIESLISGGLAASQPDSTPEIDLRGLWGSSWWGDWGSAFVNSELAWRWRSEGQPDEVRADATIGFQPAKCCLALLGFNGRMPLSGGSDSGFKIAPSFAYTFSSELGENEKKPTSRVRPSTVQFGVFYDVLNTDEGMGFQLSIWNSF